MSLLKLPRPEKGFFKGLLLLAIPMMLQNAVTFSVNFADNIMVGSLGESAISGVYLGNQLQNLLQTVIIGIDSAMLVLAAQYWGQKNTVNIKRIFSMAIRLALGLGLVFTIISSVIPEQILSLFSSDKDVIAEGVKYLRYIKWTYMFFAASQLMITSMKSVESVKVGMYSSFISLSVNVVLNYVLIFGKLGLEPMGIVGAALATLISRIIEFSVVFIYVFKIDKRLAFKFRDLLKTDPLLTKDFLRYGAPIIAGQVVWGMNTLVQSGIIGNMGASATSAFSIYSMGFQLLGVIMFALSGAVGITTGKLVGSGEVERVKNHARVVQLMYLCIGIVGCGVLLLLKDTLISFYNITPETQALANQFLIIFAVFYIGTCYQGFSLGSLVKAGGDTKFVFINDTIFVWGITIPTALILQRFFDVPPWVIFAVLKADEMLKCPVAFVKINRFKWIRNLTRPASEEAAAPAEISQSAN